MTNEQRVLVETDLFRAISAFHDLDDKELREKYAREFFSDFCKKNNIDPKEAYTTIESILDHKRKHTPFGYEHYNNLEDILFKKENDKEEER